MRSAVRADWEIVEVDADIKQRGDVRRDVVAVIPVDIVWNECIDALDGGFDPSARLRRDGVERRESALDGRPLTGGCR